MISRVDGESTFFGKSTLYGPFLIIVVIIKVSRNIFSRDNIEPGLKMRNIDGDYK